MRRRPSESSPLEEESEETPLNSSDSLAPPRTAAPPSPKKRRSNNSVSSVARHDLRPTSIEQNRHAHVGGALDPSMEKQLSTGSGGAGLRAPGRDAQQQSMVSIISPRQRLRMRNPWSGSGALVVTLLGALLIMFGVFRSFTTKQLDIKGGSMSYMASGFVGYPEFDTEHTAFATKYSLYLYREMGIDEEAKVKGAPVLFIPGNAGSYKQVRSLASEAANYFHNNLRDNPAALAGGKRTLDFFTVDFNEDITAFHGQTMLDQADYLNDAIAFILSLYHDPERSSRDPTLPDPTSVILVGHSMGGIVARTMLTRQNYQVNSVNTIITLSAPHARAPVSFDSTIVQTYKTINDYWRKSHSKQWGVDNPLWHVTLISIAGGGLDTIVPSDYSSLASLVPETHGFTVFTSTIPEVWTGMDHLRITWCDESRKVIIRALYDVLDVNRSTQTKVRGERMRSFRKHFLTGLETVAEKSLPHKDPSTLLTLQDDAFAMLPQGERLVLRELGHSGARKAYLIPVPPQGTLEGRRFTLLTNQYLDEAHENGNLEVLFCTVFPLHVAHSAAFFTMDMDFSGESVGSTRLACKNAASDKITLPASTFDARYPFEHRPPFAYLQYDLEDLAEHQFVAVVDKTGVPTSGWVVAEFSALSDSTTRSSIAVKNLLWRDLHVRLPKRRSLVNEIQTPSLGSSLFAYHLSVSPLSCGQHSQLFTPLVRQYISDVYESKFYVNTNEADISLHGIAPYMPPALHGREGSDGLALQFWVDPTCEDTVQITLHLDLFGSVGKLWMRYRTMFATLPLLIVALVMRKQFRTYDAHGIFMSFSESFNQCLRTSIPALILSLTFLATYLAKMGRSQPTAPARWFDAPHSNATESIVDYSYNDLLVGSPDSFFWFLLPVFGVVAAGLCAIINYLVLAITAITTAIYRRVWRRSSRNDDEKRTPSSFAVTSTRQRIVTTSILLSLVSTVIPYQFAYVVLCIVQIATSVRALRIASETKSEANYNFYNYAHSVLILMMWILPINLPVLVVWIRNLAVHWLTPFSSHHNILSVMPFILLVETLSTGRMIPRLQTRTQYVTNAGLFLLALCAALYGVSYAYLLHHVVNAICGWLVVVHWSTGSFSFARPSSFADGTSISENDRRKKKP